MRDTEAGQHRIFISEPKAYFPARFMSVKRTMNNLAIVLVSVLDLDNSVRFSWQTYGRSRKQPIHMLASDLSLRHQTEIIHLLMAIKQC